MIKPPSSFYTDARCGVTVSYTHLKKNFVARGLHDNVDLLPTVQELLGTKIAGNYDYDGVSYAGTLLEGEDCARESVVPVSYTHLDVYKRQIRYC